MQGSHPELPVTDPEEGAEWPERTSRLALGLGSSSLSRVVTLGHHAAQISHTLNPRIATRRGIEG